MLALYFIQDIFFIVGHELYSSQSEYPLRAGIKGSVLIAAIIFFPVAWFGVQPQRSGLRMGSAILVGAAATFLVQIFIGILILIITFIDFHGSSSSQNMIILAVMIGLLALVSNIVMLFFAGRFHGWLFRNKLAY